MGPRPEVGRWRFSAVLGKKVAQGGREGTQLSHGCSGPRRLSSWPCSGHSPTCPTQVSRSQGFFPTPSPKYPCGCTPCNWVGWLKVKSRDKTLPCCMGPAAVSLKAGAACNFPAQVSERHRGVRKSGPGFGGEGQRKEDEGRMEHRWG